MIIISLALSIQVYKPEIFIEIYLSMKWLYFIMFSTSSHFIYLFYHFAE